MVTTRTRKTTKKASIDASDVTTPIPTVVKTTTSKVVHITPSDVIGSLNSAVANINTVFQFRDHLDGEVDALKNELAVGNDVRVEKAMLEDLKREEERFIYDFSIKKERLENELKQREKDQKEVLVSMESEHKARLKSDADTQAQRLKIEKEEHNRKIALEKEDWQREQKRFTQEKVAFTDEVKKFEKDRISLRGKLIEELNRDNAHSVELLKLNHQKEIELLKGELRLEQANRAKFEAMLKDAREQNEKLGEQLTVLSKEALTSASTSSMAAKLKDIISEMSVTSPQRIS